MKFSKSAFALVVAPAVACQTKVYCKDGMAYDDRFETQLNGNPTCSAECGDNCCIGTDACDGGRFTVCVDGSCDGDASCQGVGANNGTVGLISNRSCVGPRACQNAGSSAIDDIGRQNTGHVGDISGSCRNADETVGTVGDSCSSVGAAMHLHSFIRKDGFVGNIIDSCNAGVNACSYAGYGGRVGHITGGSCAGQQSCNTLGRNGLQGGGAGNIHDSCKGEKACYRVINDGGKIGNIIGSCQRDSACEDLGYGNSLVGDVYGSCNEIRACEDVSNSNPTWGASIIGCCNSAAEVCKNVGHNLQGRDLSLPDDCNGNTIPPSPAPTSGLTLAPTQAPTVPGPLTLNYHNITANFTAGASNELEVEFVVGAGSNVTVKVYETCEKEADEVSPSLFSGNVDATPDPTAGNTTHSNIIVGYNFNKAEMINSSLWNSTSEVLTFCQVTSLRVPDQVGGSFVILEDKRKIQVKFDLDADFEVDVKLGDRTIEEETEYINFDKDVEAYKCRGGSGNSFIADVGALPPNTQLAICIRVQNNTSVDIVQLANMVIDQDGLEEPKVFVENGNPKYGFTKMPIVSEGVIVKTLLPLGDNGFAFESGLSLNISGTVDLRLATGRKLRALTGENSVAGEEGEVAEINVVVGLQSSADGFGPIGSSDGHVIVGKGLAAIGLMVLAVTVVMM